MAKNKIIINALVLLLIMNLFMMSCAQSSETAERPNIIFIMTDDHTIQAMSAYGSIINKTPNMDRIANAGIRFSNAFVTNSICAPSRAVILTGKYSHLNGVLDNAQRFDGSQQTFPKLLQGAGYQTAMVGKWHLKSDPTGFDYWNVLPGQGLYYNPDFIEMGERKNHEGYVTDLTTDFALDWLDRREQEKPFYLMLHHKAPHRNWMPGPDHLDLYNDQEIPIPDNFFDNYENRGTAAKTQEMSISEIMFPVYDLKILDATPTNGNDEFMLKRLERMTPEQRENFINAYKDENAAFHKANLQGDELAKWKYQRYIKDYLRCVASVDDNIGRVLDYLEKEGLTENTLIVYTSDQGFYLGEHGWFDKRFMYEESYKTPMVVSYPKSIKKGLTTEAMTMNLDIAPTLLEYAGVDVPEDMQGASLKSIMNNNGKEPSDWRQSTYYHYFEYPGVHAVKRHYGVRTKQYKLIHFYNDIDEWELYDLEKDPKEMKNLIEDETYASVKSTLMKELRELQKQYGDSIQNQSSVDVSRIP
ncbi:sulfatase [Roseivirga sp. E12]|uniref:sulfatase family protein n=1 Tax=Roseivirga sp. E12 TaxID=2819237 RepID=UPI001ABD11E3|nr:sulfatase [Roseivirga sp. E12]MBO3699918.1 sulfatase [Roseivirga sp. E12]